jgi:hypothetical protein
VSGQLISIVREPTRTRFARHRITFPFSLATKDVRTLVFFCALESMAFFLFFFFCQSLSFHPILPRPTSPPLSQNPREKEALLSEGKNMHEIRPGLFFAFISLSMPFLHWHGPSPLQFFFAMLFSYENVFYLFILFIYFIYLFYLFILFIYLLLAFL